MKILLNKLFRKFGYSFHLEPQDYMLRNYIVELDNTEIDIIKYVYDNKLTMSTIPKLINTLKSCYHVVQNNIPGDFVECGVWRGGNGILANKIFDFLGSDKKVWMFDTFEGMTKPTRFDKVSGSKILAEKKFSINQKDTHNEWCYASLEDVKNNCTKSGLKLNSFNFIKGDICETLKQKVNVPPKISLLRLDTDFYESTKVELEVLYPKLSNSGVLIIDDYGRWEGSRKAVDEYFLSKNFKPLFHIVDQSCRSSTKCE